MSQSGAASSFSSRTGVLPDRFALLLCCALFLLFGGGNVFGSFTKPAPVIATRPQVQVVWNESFKLEIAAGLFCGNDPVNRHDPLGLMTDEERSSLQASNRILMELIRRLGGNPWTPEEVYDQKLKTTYFLGIPQNSGLEIPWVFAWNIPIDNKSQLRSKYPWWESDHDVALRESLRSNGVRFKSLLARAGKLSRRERMGLQLQGFGLMAETTLDLGLMLAPYSRVAQLVRPNALVAPLNLSSGGGIRGHIQPTAEHHTIPQYMGAREDQVLHRIVRYQHNELHEFLDNWNLDVVPGMKPRFGAPLSFRGEVRPWARENPYLREFAAESRANREFLVEELRKFYREYGYYYQIRDVFESEAQLFIQGIE